MLYCGFNKGVLKMIDEPKEVKKRGRKPGKVSDINGPLDPHHVTLVQMRLKNYYIAFIRELTVRNPHAKLRAADFFEDLLPLLKHKLEREPASLRSFVGGALFMKYFAHLVEEKKDGNIKRD